jgi:hypothetical protein
MHIQVNSQAALQLLIKLQITSKTVRQTVELLRELAVRHTVTLQWVKAHLGFPGIEMAEEAAKAGSQSKRFRQMEISNSRTELKTFIRDAPNLEWARLWADREGIDCRQTRLFFPTLNPKVWKDIKAYSNLTPACLARIICFLTGHTFMNCHEVLIQRGRDDLGSNDALCRLNKEEMETPEHFLTECPVLNKDRQELFNSFQLSRAPDWDSKILRMVMLPMLAALED